MNELTNKWGPYRQAKLEINNYSISILFNCAGMCFVSNKNVFLYTIQKLFSFKSFTINFFLRLYWNKNEKILFVPKDLANTRTDMVILYMQLHKGPGWTILVEGTNNRPRENVPRKKCPSIFFSNWKVDQLPLKFP